MADDEKAVQSTKRERWDGEEVHVRPANKLVGLVGYSPTKVKVSAL
jgi:hypothetical protein